MSIAVIIPAYNEEKTIGPILKELCSIKIIDEIIVVNDGSTDKTVNVAKNHGVKVIDLCQNTGKSRAVITGVESTTAQIILMLDADLIGLKEMHVMELLNPVLKGDAEMTIGIFKHGRGTTDFAQKIAPFLSGQRALKRELFKKLKNHRIKDFGIEMALTLMAESEKIKVKEVFLKDLTHVMKEEKRGFILGFLSRMKMYWDIIFCVIKYKLEVL